jgi:hypothetical protein
MHWPERSQIYFYLFFAAAWMLKFVFVYLANMPVLCYSWTIICCCQVQDYIYWIKSTENDHRHHHKFIKYEKRLRKEGKTCSAYLSSKIFATSARIWTRSTSFSSFQRSNWSPTYILHLFIWKIWSLWPNIRFLPSIVTEKNVTKNVHIQMYVKNMGYLYEVCDQISDFCHQ